MSLIQDLRHENIHAIGIVPEADKVMRMSAQTAPIEAGAVLLPSRAAWLDEFRRELLEFPNGRHDDQVDALSQGLQRAYAPPTAPVAASAPFHVARGLPPQDDQLMSERRVLGFKPALRLERLGQDGQYET